MRLSKLERFILKKASQQDVVIATTLRRSWFGGGVPDRDAVTTSAIIRQEFYGSDSPSAQVAVSRSLRRLVNRGMLDFEWTTNVGRRFKITPMGLSVK